MLARIDPRQKIDRILIFDWDGVACNTDHHAIASMRYALQQYLAQYHLPFSEDYFQQVLHETSGTTEQAFLKRYLRSFNITRPFHNIQVETSDFDIYRSRYLCSVDSTDKNNIHYDFRQLLARCKARDRVEHKTTVYAIGTGNPDQTFAQRLPQDIAQEFDMVVGGIQDDRRYLLVHNIFAEIRARYSVAVNYDKNPATWNDHFRHTITYYFDDTVRAIEDVARGKKERILNNEYFDLPNLRLILVDRKNEHRSEFLELQEHNLLMRVNLLNDIKLMDFLNPRSHEPLEGKILEQELEIKRSRRNSFKEQG